MPFLQKKTIFLTKTLQDHETNQKPSFEEKTKSPPTKIALAGILFCLVVIFHLKGHSQSCTPPPECGANPIYFCGEVTDFNWAAIPNGQGEYNIAVFSSAGPSVVVTFYLTDGFSVTGPLNGAGTFQDIPPGCYQIIICVDGDVDYYCCKTLPCLPQEDGCCVA